jgi:O-antigen/teichoic acid export membrane protein
VGVDEQSREGGKSDYLSILSGTSQNVVGILVAAIATYAAQFLMGRVLGRSGFGAVTVLTQAAFVLSFATRSGMDMAVLRNVAVDIGAGRVERIRAEVSRAVAIAFGVSVVVALALIAGAPLVRDVLPVPVDNSVVIAAVAGLPFLALANVWLSATRGLKIMRYTLYIFWAGQPTAWVVLMLLGWTVSPTELTSVGAYSASWALAAVGAWYFWRKEARSWPAAPLEPGAATRLLRFAGPRAPAALFSQLLFWTDLFVVTHFVTDTQVGVYSAALRAGQILVLFLTSVNLMFSPFVADLHARGERDRLDRLYKTLTRWTLAATLPAFLLIAVAPSAILKLFGSGFEGGKVALLILLGGQLINIATGSVGFILIMVGRTGWDLVVYAFSLVLDISLAIVLASRYGIKGAAIANAVTFGVSNLARLYLVKRFVNIWPYDRSYLRMLGPAAISFVVMWFVYNAIDGKPLVALLATAVLGGIAYLLGYLAIGLTPEERDGVGKLWARLRPRPGVR